LGSKIRCTCSGKIHFETDSLINLLHLSAFSERLINQSVICISVYTTLGEYRNHALFSSGTNLGSKFLCTNLDNIHFETDSLINLLHSCHITVHDFGRVGIAHYFLRVQIWARKFSVRFFGDSLINLLHVSAFTRLRESRNHALLASGTNLGSKIRCTFLDKIHLINQSIRPVNISRETHYSICYIYQRLNNIRRVRMTHYFLLVQIWARKFSVRFWTRFISLINV